MMRAELRDVAHNVAKRLDLLDRRLVEQVLEEELVRFQHLQCACGIYVVGLPDGHLRGQCEAKPGK